MIYVVDCDIGVTCFVVVKFVCFVYAGVVYVVVADDVVGVNYVNNPVVVIVVVCCAVVVVVVADTRCCCC